jgi:alpha-mannosidase
LEWIDYSDKDQKGGVSVLHKGIPSHEIRDNSIYLTLLRSVVVLSSDGIMGPCIPTPDAAETRPYTFNYSILPHEDSWNEAATYRHGIEVNMSLIAIQINNNKNNKNIIDAANESEKEENNQNGRRKYLPSTYSFLQIDPKNIVLSTLKLSEDKNAIIVRFYETEDKKTLAKLRFAKKIKSICLTDLLENDLNQVINVNGNYNTHYLEIEVEPFKIVTLKVKF